MKFTFRASFVLCLLPAFLGAQQQTTPPPAQPQPAPSAAKPEGSDNPFTVSAIYWLTTQRPNLFGGDANTSPYITQLNFPGKGKASPELEVDIPAGTGSYVRISAFQTTSIGNLTAASNMTLFGVDYAPGDYLASQSRLRNVKASFDYLSFPFPLKGSKFRLKTLWEVQYTTIRGTIDAPLKAITTDSTGNPLSNTAQGTRSLVYPTFGLALEDHVSRNLQWSIRGSGFGLPGRHGLLYDSEARLSYKIGHISILAGGRVFHVKTSPKSDQFYSVTLYGPYVGLSWSAQ